MFSDGMLRSLHVGRTGILTVDGDINLREVTRELADGMFLHCLPSVELEPKLPELGHGTVFEVKPHPAIGAFDPGHLKTPKSDAADNASTPLAAL